jgi:hypothetical protein
MHATLFKLHKPLDLVCARVTDMGIYVYNMGVHANDLGMHVSNMRIHGTGTM